MQALLSPIVLYGGLIVICFLLLADALARTSKIRARLSHLVEMAECHDRMREVLYWTATLMEKRNHKLPLNNVVQVHLTNIARMLREEGMSKKWFDKPGLTNSD